MESVEKEKATRDKVVKISIISLSVLILVFSCFMFFSAINNAKKIEQVAVKETPYQVVDVKNAPATDFSENVASYKYTENWVLTEDRNTNYPDFLPCKPGKHEDSLLLVRKGADSHSKLIVQAYGAGQGLGAYSGYVNAVNRCDNKTTSWKTDNGISITSFSTGFVMLGGDAIILSDNNNQDFIDTVETVMLNELKNSQCVSVDPGQDSASRSIFYDPESYKGLILTETLEAKTAKVSEPNVTNMSVPEIPDLVKEPEAPLPENFPSAPKDKPEKITYPDRPVNETFTATGSYQAEDVDGPACGWKWSGQQAPKVDKDALEKEKEDAFTLAQDEANNKAISRFNQFTQWTISMMDMTDKYYAVVDYVEKLNKVNQARTDLMNNRKAFQPEWEKYINELKKWAKTVDENKRKEKELKECLDRNKNYRSLVSPSSEKEDGKNNKRQYITSPQESVCDPSSIGEILSVDLPSRPTVPDNITLPESWVKTERLILDSHKE